VPSARNAAAAEIEPFAAETRARDARTRVLSHRSPEVSWELWLREPPPALSGLVVGLWAGDADTGYSCHHALPNGELSLTFNLGPPQRVKAHGDAGSGCIVRTALVCGLQERTITYESVTSHPRVVAVRLLPRGAWAFFDGLPLAELANEIVDLDAVLGRAAAVEPLRQRLVECADLGDALDVLERWLVARVVRGPAAHPSTRAALRDLTAQRGNLRIEALARDLGVSRRHLNGLFRREIGLSAKSLARILRFERAQEALAAAGGSDLTQIALDCGYYDQAHMNRDFRELAGLTPSDYAARLFATDGWREVHS